ncbi:MAG: hypothetical protein WA421_07380 [Nitrososphaeraceae archaeon]
MVDQTPYSSGRFGSYHVLVRARALCVYVPFSKQKVDELSKYFTDSVQFAIEGLGCDGRTYSSSFEELRDMEWDELVKIKTAYLKSDSYRNKQLLTAGVR